MLIAMPSSGRWQFDLPSAIIGALVALCLAGLIYNRRATLVRTWQRVWAPIAAWRRRQRASQEEKALLALQERLKQLLWFSPDNPTPILRPRAFRALAPLPTTLVEVATHPRTITVPQSALLAGHRKLIITGAQGSGRTTALMMATHQVSTAGGDTTAQAPARLPLWLDLARLSEIQVKNEASAAKRLVSLAIAFLPVLLPAWVLQHLRRAPCLVLIDNWETLTAEERAQVSAWIAEADATFADVFWMVSSGPESIGQLVEHGFVPIELLPIQPGMDVPELYAAWCTALHQPCEEPNDESLAPIAAAADAGAPLWEIQLRTRLYIETGELPERPVEVVDRALQAKIEAVDLGRVPEELVQQAQSVALDVLVAGAAALRLEQRIITEQALREVIVAHIPPETDRVRRLEATVRKLIDGTGLLEGNGKGFHFKHAVWLEYLAACHLAQQETGEATVLAHVVDPTWAMLIEFYAGIADMTSMVETATNRAEVYGDPASLLRAARWGIVANPDQPWRTSVIKTLAQTFIQEGLEMEERLALGRAVALVAGDGARAFFIRILRHPSTDVRSAALRGIGWCRSSPDMALLAAAIRDEIPQIREGAVRALKDFNTPGAFAYLAECLPQVDETLMPVITEALATSQDGWMALEDASQVPDLLVRRAAALGLGLVNDRWAVERLEEMAREDAEWLVRSAAEAALHARDERDMQLERVSSPPQPDVLDWLIAWAARQGTGLGVGDAALEMLARAAREGNVDARILSALTLAQIGREVDIPTLESLLGHTDAGVATTAAWALNLLRQRYRSDPTA